MDQDCRLLTPDEVAKVLGITRRRVLKLPIKQIRIGDRTIRFRLNDVYAFGGLDGLDNPGAA